MSEKNTVFITGASAGIGYATALAFSRRGWNVVGTARRLDRLQGLQDAMSASGGVFLPIQADVADADAMQRAVQQTLDRFGRIDALIANAGVGHRGDLVSAEWQDLKTVLDTNIDGVLHSIRAVVPTMRQQKRGHVVIVSSIVHNMVTPYASIYSASKAFVSSLAQSLRFELEADGIRVTDMLIGRTQTEFNDKRLGLGERRKSRLPEMTAEQVADGMVRVVCDRPRPRVALRWFDRLVLIANVLIPDFIGRRALKQYR